MKLVSMVEFVIDQELSFNDNDSQSLTKIFSYAHFLKKPLRLSMFVPCDLDGNILEEPENYKDYFQGKLLWSWNNTKYQNFFDDNDDFNEWKMFCQKYQEANENILFEPQYKSGTKELWLPNGGKLSSMCIEDLIFLNYTLTQSGKKQIGL